MALSGHFTPLSLYLQGKATSSCTSTSPRLHGIVSNGRFTLAEGMSERTRQSLSIYLHVPVTNCKEDSWLTLRCVTVPKFEVQFPRLPLGSESTNQSATSRKVAGSRTDEVNAIFFSIYLILPVALGPGIYSASNRNEYQKQKKCFWGVERGRCLRLDNLTAIGEPIV
jgi:hypothetical protein